MALIQHPTPPHSILKNDEISPDIVFIISKSNTGSPAIGYFCSRSSGVAPQSGWLSFPANQDTWVWLNPASGTGHSDTAWPNNFYLVAAPAQFSPAPAANGYTTASYTSGSWNYSASGTPNTTGPTYMFSVPAGSGANPMGYVQLSGTTRSWYKSGDTTMNDGNPPQPFTTWPQAYIPMSVPPLGQWIQFQSVPASQPGANPRFVITSTPA